MMQSELDCFRGRCSGMVMYCGELVQFEERRPGNEVVCHSAELLWRRNNVQLTVPGRDIDAGLV
jgi:hypothetical protein